MKGASLVILGVITVLAIMGLVANFTNDDTTGAIFSSYPGGPALCAVETFPGEAQWFSESDITLVKRYLTRGAQCAIITDGKIMELINSIADLSGVDRAQLANMCCRWP